MSKESPEPKVEPASAAREDTGSSWKKYATPYRPDGRPMIAILLDDVGVAKQNAELALELPPFVSLALMTYADNVDRLASRAREAGHELLVHMPMEPLDGKLDAGKNALKVGLSDKELRDRIDWGLDRFSGYIGINNHMGSRFTQDRKGMEEVLDILKKRGLVFLDSRTIGNSLGATIAEEMDVPHLTRDVFLDNEIDAGPIREQLSRTEQIAQRQGYAIAIGHPHPETVAVLHVWIKEAQAKGFQLVPISYILCKKGVCQ